MNNVTIPHALYIEKNIVYKGGVSFRDGWYELKKTHSVVIRSIGLYTLWNQ